MIVIIRYLWGNCVFCLLARQSRVYMNPNLNLDSLLDFLGFVSFVKVFSSYHKSMFYCGNKSAALCESDGSHSV